jgi:hypothetical protein
MFGISHTLNLSTNCSGRTSTALGTAAFQSIITRRDSPVFSRITPIKGKQLTGARQNFVPQPGLRASIKPQAIFSSRDQFLPESNTVFYADIQLQGADQMSDCADHSTQSGSDGVASKAVVHLDTETLGEQTRVMIRIGEDLKSQPLPVVEQALTNYLQSPEIGFQNMKLTVTQHLSPHVVVAELSLLAEYSSELRSGAPSENDESAINQDQPTEEKQKPARRHPVDFLRARFNAAINQLQQCKGVLAIESDHRVRQLSATKTANADTLK